MVEIIKTYKEKVPAMRFIGKKYNDFGHWGDWFANGWFDVIENAMGGVASILPLWKDGGAYVGLERNKDKETFEYWIGMFTPPDVQVPDDFLFIDFPETNFDVCWIGMIINSFSEISKNFKYAFDGQSWHQRWGYNHG